MWQIDVTSQTYGALADDEYRGLYVPRAEVEILGAAAPELPPDLAARRAELSAERAAICAAQEASESPLDRLVRLFELSPFECDVLLLALASELDLRFERIYAYIQDDVTKKRPAVDLALRLFCATPEERQRNRAAFAPDAPLLQHRLIQLFEDGQRHAPLLARFIKLDDRIVAELLASPQEKAETAMVERTLTPFVTLTRPCRSFDDLVLPNDLLVRLRRMTEPHGNAVAFSIPARNGTAAQTSARITQPRAFVLALQGGYGSGRKAIAEALCTAAGAPLLIVALDRLVESDATSALLGGDPGETIQLILREARLHRAAILWQAADRVLGDGEPTAWRTPLLHALDAYPG